MNELEIHSELLKVNNIHHSLNESNILTYVILRETNKSRFNQAQLDWIQERIDLLEEQNRQANEDSLKHVDLELCKMPLLSKTSDVGEMKQVL
jgi:hypothetical protein